MFIMVLFLSMGWIEMLTWVSDYIFISKLLFIDFTSLCVCFILNLFLKAITVSLFFAVP